ncbi:MAG: cation diffusion facilitator family transporter, partial [Arenicellales bacterium]|nr:cation diffusion facilitator family transporter [Arenicellales bacterium]
GIVDLLLSGLKVSGGIIFQSQVLIADGIHSLSDLLTDGIVLFTARQASFEADREHPYGHGRIQAIGTGILAVSLGAVAIGIGWDAIRTLLGSKPLAAPGWIALGIGVVSVLAKEIIFQYTIRAARRLRSGLLKANAWHSRSDALSSLVVIVGVGGAMLGFPWADAAGALVVAFLIAYAAYQIGKEAVEELIDTAVDSGTQSSIRSSAGEVPGVLDVHELRTRTTGGDVLADMHVRVNPRISVSEGHQIADEVVQRLRENFEELSDIVVHIDPEDDFDSMQNGKLLDRNILETALQKILVEFGLDWNMIKAQPNYLTLHFLKNQIHAQLILPCPDEVMMSNLRQISPAMTSRIISTTEIDDIEVLVSIASYP